jgi:hypothetical protein
VQLLILFLQSNVDFLMSTHVFDGSLSEAVSNEISDKRKCYFPCFADVFTASFHNFLIPDVFLSKVNVSHFHSTLVRMN